jgi:nucleotide sugar dehydrogenase
LGAFLELDAGRSDAHVNDLKDRLITLLDRRRARVAVIGQGHVGLPVAMRASQVGYSVIGFDTDLDRVAALRDCKSYVGDVADQELAGALGTNYLPSADTADLDGFDVAVITVPTPLRDGVPDLVHVERAGDIVAGALTEGALVVLESTTYPGTTKEFLRPILERSGFAAGRQFFLGYSPERIDPGNRTWHLVNTPKVVSGIDDSSLACVDAFYRTLVDEVVTVGSTGDAELVKLLENTYRHVNIALVNELAMYAADLGLDIWSAIDAASTKPFGYSRFTPGPGVGGHCLPVDPSYLSWEVKRRLGRTFRFVELANDVNAHMPDYVVTRVSALLNKEGMAVRASSILVLGLSYKPGTSDWRESPSLAIVDRLLALGARVRACEPHLPEVGRPMLPIPIVPCTAHEITAADLVLVLVDHPEFPYEEVAGLGRLVLDTRGSLRGRVFRGESL